MRTTAVTQTERLTLLDRYSQVRRASHEMCQTLEPAEFRVQPLDDVSPPWWNLGHTSWFFARNLLSVFGGETTQDDEAYDGLLNSYYASLGQRWPRGQRGLVTRPTTEEIFAYRVSVDRRVTQLIESIPAEHYAGMAEVLNIGLQHEQQHQELFYTEIKCILAQNPPHLRRAYTSGKPIEASGLTEAAAPQFIAFDGGLFDFGNLEAGWCWDNELPVHKQYLAPFALADRLVTNADYLQFMNDGGYRNQLLWLDNGWQQCQTLQWQAPLYWERYDDGWQTWMLSGMQPLAGHEPLCHVSFYEADAFARWQGETFAEQSNVRLPTEREWEHAARSNVDRRLRDMIGVTWQWTASYYEPYPGYRPYPGALAEYNGKFMDNQRVLRGGSWATPPHHFRISYRNFWPATTRFQFTGLRLARDA